MLTSISERVWTPPFMQEESSWNLSTWSGADVCPASSCGFTLAAGPYGNTRIGSITFTRARHAVRLPGFSDPVSLTVVHRVQETFSHDLPARRTGRNLSAYRRRSMTDPINAAFRHQRPGANVHRERQALTDARHFVGKRYDDQHRWLPLQHTSEPRARPSLPPRGPSDDRAGTNNEQTAQIPMSHLRGSSQSDFPTA